MSDNKNYLNEFALRSLVRFLRDEKIDTLAILEKHKAKALGNDLGYDDGLGPDDKIKGLKIIESTILSETKSS